MFFESSIVLALKKLGKQEAIVSYGMRTADRL
jgi:hypothetical protein